MTDTPNTNDNTFDNDPMLTAYALGELGNTSEDYQRIEALLASDKQARAYVDQVRALSGKLTQSYAADQAAPLSDTQQQSLADAIDAKPAASIPFKPSSETPRPFKLSRPLLLAAGLAIAATAAITTVSLMDNDTTPVAIDTDNNAPAVIGLAQITEALNTPVAVDFEDAALSEVLVFLNKQTGVDITADWDALEKRGVSRATIVSLYAEEPQPARALLNAALQVAWAQSPHPDPAQWTMTDQGVGIAPKSTLVQARLDATAKLLADRRFSKSPVIASLTQAPKAEVWDTNLWNEIHEKRAEAGQLVIAEAAAVLDNADKAIKEDQVNPAIEHMLYAYRLLGTNAALMDQQAIVEPLERIASLRSTIQATQARLDKAAIADAIAKAKADDTELDDYNAAMAAASEALTNGSFQAATDALAQAQTALIEQQEKLDQGVLIEKAGLLQRLSAEVYQNRRQLEDSRFASVEQERTTVDPDKLKADDKRKQAEVQDRLKAARQAQLSGNYDKATNELDAALLLEPESKAIRGLRDMIVDSNEVSKRNEARGRNLKEANQRLLNIEATTPYDAILTYPGDWPELTASRPTGTTASKPGAGYDRSGGGGNGSAIIAGRGKMSVSGVEYFGGGSASISGYGKNNTPGEAYFKQSAIVDSVDPFAPSAPLSPTILDEKSASKPMPKMRLEKKLESLNARIGNNAPGSTLGPAGQRYWYANGQFDSALGVAGTASGGTVSRRLQQGQGQTRDGLVAFALPQHQAERETGLVSEAYARSARYNESISHYYSLSLGVDAKGAPDVERRKKAADAVRGRVSEVIAVNGVVPAEPHNDLTRAEQLRWQFERVSDELDAGKTVEEAERTEISKLSDKERDELKADFDERIAQAEVTGPIERKRIDALKHLGELERRFIEESRKALIEDPEMSRDAFALVNDNPFYNPADPGRTMSTFSVDVDTAGYSIVRKKLMGQNQLPVPKSVRIEEMINYFDYGYKAPVVDGRALEDGVVTQASLEKFEKDNEGFAPFATDIQLTDAPWQMGNKLVRIGIQGMDVTQEERPSCHLTFLLDVSGSMNRANKLPLVKQSMKLLLDKLNAKDRVSIVVYAGRTATVLENASAADRGQIEQALDNLKAGGSTAGAAGITLAYEAAKKHYIDGGVNRVILCTDGDFNVGIRDKNQLVSLIKEKANPKADEDGKKRGVYLSVMGYGMGNLNDAMMEPLTNAGNGNYAYIDSLQEATRVMYDQAGSTLVTIAKDVKVQVQFDPQQVLAYRLIGYENRVLANKDFANDKVDAGDIGAGHSVTALYEVVPFDGIDGLQDDDAIREVRHQIEELDKAIALNQSMMYTVALNDSERIRLTGATRMLNQERELADAALAALAKPRVGEAAVVEELPEEAPPAEEGEVVEADIEPVEPLEDGAMMEVRLRYKPVDAPAEDGTSRLIETPVFAHQAVVFEQADEPTRFAASVAGFGMLLRSSPHAGDATMDWVIQTAGMASNHDPDQRRAEFIKIVKKAQQMMPQPKPEVEPDVIR